MLKRKVAVVTGSTSGIGKGIAERLAAAGCDIVLNGFGEEAKIEAQRQAVEAEFGVRCRYAPSDVTNPEQVETMIAEANDDLGSVDILVNNAGIQFTSSIQDFPLDKWNAVIATNLSAAFFTTKAVLPQMYARNWGRIINIASAHGLVASAEKAAYVAAKHGIVGLTKVTALESAKTGVTCNAICPGWVLTPLVRAQIEKRAESKGTSVEEESQALLSEKQPSGEFVTAHQLGELAVFLCSDAASQMRGHALSVDGGWTAQ
ncbi:MAG: 3-hydroxybutyrate dehydrogenase [Geminicoccaceae bacterium]|nr:MAG: 3-hydroxybutyrate dehydrogenase [Geminicoccaceae bacterium]